MLPRFHRQSVVLHKHHFGCRLRSSFACSFIIIIAVRVTIFIFIIIIIIMNDVARTKNFENDDGGDEKTGRGVARIPLCSSHVPTLPEGRHWPLPGQQDKLPKVHVIWRRCTVSEAKKMWYVGGCSLKCPAPHYLENWGISCSGVF